MDKTHRYVLALSLCLGGAVAISLPANSAAATLALYEFSGTLNSSDLDADSVASAFLDGPGLVGSISGEGNPPGSLRAGPNHTPATLQDAVLNGDYFEFSVAPVTGMEIHYTSISLDFSVSSQAEGISGYEGAITVRSSADGFTNNLLSDSRTVQVPNAVPFFGSSASLAVLGTRALPTTFRIFIHDTTDLLPGGIRVDNVKVEGTLAPVPLPAPFWLLASALCGIGASRRRL